jgi:outer membrane lipoprotein SlyB
MRPLLLLLPLLLTACASTAPVINPPETPSESHTARAEADARACLAKADERVGRNALQASPKKATKDVARVAGIAAVTTGVARAVTDGGEVWKRARGAAAGGAVGMGLKLLLDWDAPDEVYEKYVERCLSERGHKVLGWR